MSYSVGWGKGLVGYMRYEVDIAIASDAGERELDLERIKDQLKQEIQRQYAEKGYVNIPNLNLHDDWTVWLRVGLAL